MVLDGHADLLYDVVRRAAEGETEILTKKHLPRLRAGSVEGLVLAIWAAPEAGETYAENTARMVAAAQAEFAASPWLKVVRTAAEAEQAKGSKQIYAFLSVEGMAAIGADLTGIDRYAALGARFGTLTWNEENLLATGAGGDPDRPLTALGRQAVCRMQKLGMMVDVSHLNDAGFWNVIDLAERPVLASHSNCRALCDVPRNLTDDQLRAIRDTGGVVGVNSFHRFAHADPRQQTVEMLARHACHMAEVMGVEHVVCGFDFCGYFGPGNESVKGLEDCSQSDNFFGWLERFGMTAQEREQVARGNLLRLLR